MPQPATTQELTIALQRLYGPPEEGSQKPLRYIIYVRKSTDDIDKQARSLGDQLSECSVYAEKNNLLLARPDHIAESGSAKTSDNRPAFRAMLDAIRSGKYDGIIAWHPDRLARNMKEAGEIIDMLDKGTIKDLRFVSFNFDNTPSGKMHLGITFVLAKQYSDQLAQNVSRGIGHSIEDGAYINRPKHGYYKDTAQRLRPDGRNHDLIKTAYAMRLEGQTFKQIAEFLNAQHYERAYKGGSHRPFKWDKQTAQKVLRDPVFAGVVVYGKNNIANLTELYDFVPAVSVEDFMAANRLRGGNNELIKLTRSYHRAENVKADLLRGMVYCSACGEPRSAGLTGKKSKNGKVFYFYYRCETPGCKLENSSTRPKVIVEYVNSLLATKPFSSEKAYRHYVTEMQRVQLERSEEHRALLRSLQGKQKALAAKSTHIKDYLLAEKDPSYSSGFKADLSKNEKELAEVEEEVAKLQEKIENEKNTILAMPEFLENMEKVAQIIASTKKLAELDFCIKKLFSNFYTDKKNIASATFAEPFASLVGQKGIECGP